MSTEQKLREALEELLYAHTDKAVAMARAALSLPATEKASAEQEPVGCMVEASVGVMLWPISDWKEALLYCDDGEQPVKLYAAPVSQPYGSTDLPYKHAIPQRTETLRLLSWITRQFGNDHPACGDVEALASAAPVSQPAPADEWAPYLKEGEAPIERLRREIADNDAICTLLADARRQLQEAQNPAPAPLPELSQSEIDACLHELDSLAREHESYEYGLPVHFLNDGDYEDKAQIGQRMRNAIRAALAAKQQVPELSKADRKDAERWRWLREQHEGHEDLSYDAEGFPMPLEPTALAFTVFKPERGSLEPVGCIPGELDETIDAALAAQQKGGV